MLLKPMDGHANEIALLEEAARKPGEIGKRAGRELKLRLAGMKGERKAAYQIDFHFGDTSKNWVVIHDLRIEYAGRVAQIDHLLLNRFLYCYVLESKHFHAGIKITEEGEFLRWNDFKHTYEGMASPIEQNARHVAVLRDAMGALVLPSTLGITIPPTFKSYVLVSEQSRIDRPKQFDSSQVVKADQLRDRVFSEIDKMGVIATLASAARMVSRETLRKLGNQLVRLHQPVEWRLPGRLLGSEASAAAITPPPSPPVTAADRRSLPPAQTGPVAATTLAAPPEAASTASPPQPRSTDPAKDLDVVPSCKRCGSGAGALLHGKFGYYFKCAACGTNTAIRFRCVSGHHPRLRKAGDTFYRECGECGSSRTYFVNA